MLAIEGRRLGWIEAASDRIVRIVEPETELKRVGRCQRDVRIESEDLVQQNGLDSHSSIVCVLPDFYVRLIPRKPEILEVWIKRAIRAKLTALHREQIKR